ncbi:Hypothetical protein NTJ_04162, partial [Nesidiocoris tenuis]
RIDVREFQVPTCCSF